MFEWLKKRFRKRPIDVGDFTRAEPEIVNGEIQAVAIKPTVDRLKKPIFTARQGGQKRNRRHIYHQPYGYPIRACDWIAVDDENLEDIKYPPPGALWPDYVTCRHCLAIAERKRGNPYGGVPIPGRQRG